MRAKTGSRSQVRSGKRPSHCYVAAVCFAPVILAALMVGCRDGRVKEQPLHEFGIEFLGRNPFADKAGQKDLEREPCLESLSADGRWLSLHIGSSWYGKRFFFDVARRRVVAMMVHTAPISVNSTSPLTFAHWTPEHYIVARRKLDTTTQSISLRSVTVYELNLLEGKVRLVSSLPPDRAPPGGHNSMILNDSFTKAAYDNRVGLEDRIRQTIVVLDLKSGETVSIARKETLRDSLTWMDLWRWHPDGRRVLLRESRRTTQTVPRFGFRRQLAALNIQEIAGSRPPRRIAFAEQFDQMLDRENPAHGEVAFFHILRSCFLDNGRRLRCLVRLRSRSAPSNVASDTCGLWDLDIESGTLFRVARLEGPAIDAGRFVFSPSGKAWLEEQTSPTMSTRGKPRPVKVVLHRIGHAPQPLPILIFVQGNLSPILSGTGFDGGDTYDTSLRLGVRFLDEDTLVYTLPRWELWTFDLRTHESTLLWRPKISGDVKL